jgi:hypothetical protein
VAARSVARVLEEWSVVSRVFHRAPRPILTELELSRTLDLAASVLGEPEPIMPMQRGGQTVPSRQRLNAVTVLAEREPRLSALQRLALVDVAASWLSDPNSGDQLAHALLAAACTTDITAEHALEPVMLISGCVVPLKQTGAWSYAQCTNAAT